MNEQLSKWLDDYEAGVLETGEQMLDRLQLIEHTEALNDGDREVIRILRRSIHAGVL